MSGMSTPDVIVSQDRFQTAPSIEEAAQIDEGWVVRTHNKTVEAEVLLTAYK